MHSFCCNPCDTSLISVLVTTFFPRLYHTLWHLVLGVSDMQVRCFPPAKIGISARMDLAQMGHFDRSHNNLHSILGGNAFSNKPGEQWIGTRDPKLTRTLPKGMSKSCSAPKLGVSGNLPRLGLEILEGRNSWIHQYPLVNQHSYGKSLFLMGKSTINRHFQ